MSIKKSQPDPFARIDRPRRQALYHTLQRKGFLTLFSPCRLCLLLTGLLLLTSCSPQHAPHSSNEGDPSTVCCQEHSSCCETDRPASPSPSENPHPSTVLPASSQESTHPSGTPVAPSTAPLKGESMQILFNPDPLNPNTLHYLAAQPHLLLFRGRYLRQDSQKSALYFAYEGGPEGVQVERGAELTVSGKIEDKLLQVDQSYWIIGVNYQPMNRIISPRTDAYALAPALVIEKPTNPRDYPFPNRPKQPEFTVPTDPTNPRPLR